MEIKFQLYTPVIDTNSLSIDCIQNNKGYISQILTEYIEITWKRYTTNNKRYYESSTIYTKEYINLYIKSDLEKIRNDKIQQLLYHQQNANRNF